MRPINRGPVPLLANGQPQTVSDYRDWRLALAGRLGNYCCYCDMPLNNSPQVEHVVPQSGGGAPLTWDNLLLACSACNRAKWDYPCAAAPHALPDIHNTYLAFKHQVVPHPRLPGRQACIMQIRTGLNRQQRTKAAATLGLCKLDQVPGKPGQVLRMSDVRWQKRLEAWVTAGVCRQVWDNPVSGATSQALVLIKEVVQARGFFSVWFDVFHDVRQVKKMLVDAFPNTAACFPAPNFDPVVRVTGDL